MLPLPSKDIDVFEEPCQFACGECCTYWRDVFPASEHPEYKDLDECPHMTDKGCGFDFENRPGACREYLCEVGEAIAHGWIDTERAQSIVDANLRWEPGKWGNAP